MTRRVLLGTGAVVAASAAVLGGAQVTDRLDDLADVAGIEPTPLPDPGDTRIVAATARDLAGLLALVEATSVAHPPLSAVLAPLGDLVREQTRAIGGRAAQAPAVAPPGDAGDAATALAAVFEAAAARRAGAAVEAASPDLVRVLASMSAGHAQGARVVRGQR